MLGRVVAIGLISVTVGSVVALAVIALLPSSRIQTLGEAVVGSGDEDARFSGETGAWTVSGRFFARGAGNFEIELRVVDRSGQAAADDTTVQVALSMPGHPMSPVPTIVWRTEAGVYRAVGEVSMYGRWRAQILLPDGVIHVPLDIGS